MCKNYARIAGWMRMGLAAIFLARANSEYCIRIGRGRGVGEMDTAIAGDRGVVFVDCPWEMDYTRWESARRDRARTP